MRALDEAILQRLRRGKRGQCTTVPLVIQEEKYFSHALKHKLHTGQDTVKMLASQGLLRKEQEGNINTTSLAETIGVLYNVPSQEVLLTRAQAIERAQDSPDILFNAYSGAKWFDRFTRTHQLHTRNLNVREWLPVTRRQLEDLIFVIRKFVIQLEGAGFIPALNGSYSERSPHNYIEPMSLARLVAHLGKRTLEETLIKAEDDPLLAKMIAGYEYQRLRPYLREHKLESFKLYSMSHAAAVTEKLYGTISTAQQLGTIPRGAQEGHNVKLYGIDIAIYALQQTQKQSFSPDELADLFAVKKEDIRPLQLHRGVNGYNSEKVAHPVYRAVADRVREKMRTQHESRSARETRKNKSASAKQ